MSDDPKRPRSQAESAMAANAESRNRQARLQDNLGRDQQSGSKTSGGRGGEQLQQSIEEAFRRRPKPARSDAVKTADIEAAKAKAEALLREASDLLANRTNDA